MQAILDNSLAGWIGWIARLKQRGESQPAQ